MRENSHHHEESERERGERSHHHEESERGERRGRRERGERSHRHEESERGERRRGSHRHTSWRSTDEDGSRRERVERGMLRYLLLDALRHGPKHGYEMIKWLEEQTYGRYAPSAGTVYPTLQLLEDQGLILAERTEEKSVYRLTEMGEAELQAHADFTKEFWERYGHPVPPPPTLLSIEFVYEELQSLQRTVEKGVHMLTQQVDQQSLLSLRKALERSKNEIRDLLAGGSAPQQMSSGSYDSPVDARELEEAIAHMFVSEDEALRQTLVRAREQGLPPIQVSALQGKLLQVLARACQARKILEI
ncbi:MAG: helix-turn-helix transcriptional regulator, partial [Ktedonobacteraceae bacterium]|nr:helix-turn-helix transcriptional regulator [Ktedonobacteraceae bacterium]